jgi:glycosyltransferase involved in cell wall biosynthesis
MSLLQDSRFKTQNPQSVLFVHNGRERFVLDDLRLLRARHRVTDWYQPRRFFNPARLFRLVRKHDVIFCWFAGWHSFAPVLFARLLGKRSIVAVGGYDTANLPEAGYGLQRGGFPRFISRLTIRNATLLAAFSQSARREAIANAGARPGKTRVIYPGVHSAHDDRRPTTDHQQSIRNPEYPLGAAIRNKKLVLTVGNVWEENLLRKGLLPFVQTARLMPDVHFVLAGKAHDSSIETLKKVAGANVAFPGFVTDEELAALYAQASVYVQASIHEGFGLSVAEAMAAGCIPVVTRAGALPEVVDDCGVYAASSRPEDIAQAVRTALCGGDEQRAAAQQRVRELFSSARRAEGLETAICEK